jgi:flagellar assembly factor FliW
VLIQTSRFGAVQLPEQGQEVVTFVEGMLGFPHLKSFVFLDDPNDEIFAWLQSCQDPQVAFPILEPELFAENYQVRLTAQEKEDLGLVDGQTFRLYCIVTIPEDATQMTANMKAPVVLNPRLRRARQCVLSDNTLAIREPVFQKLQQRLVQTRGVLEKPTKSMDFAVLLAKQNPDHQI